MQSENVDIETRHGVANAYLARPDADPHPGVLFIMDAYGLRPRIEEMAQRIAADGYIVLAPNVFYRAGRDPVGPLPDLSDPEVRASFTDAPESPHRSADQLKAEVWLDVCRARSRESGRRGADAAR